jgi:hypothetical protein
MQSDDAHLLEICRNVRNEKDSDKLADLIRELNQDWRCAGQESTPRHPNLTSTRIAPPALETLLFKTAFIS